jgi:glutamate synthase (NADPH/NADH) small chain
MVLGEIDSSGRARPMPTNEFEEVKIDNLIIAIGHSPNPIIKNNTPLLKTDSWGRVIVDDYQTSIKGVFAGGDTVTGAATVILAMGAGKEAAIKIDEYIKPL